MFDWTKISSNPTDSAMLEAWKQYYNQHIVRFNLFHAKSRDDRVLDLCQITKNGNIKLLDIGFAEHGVEFAKRPDWFHHKLRAFNNNRIFGLDINESAVREISALTKYENLIVGDATNPSLLVAGGEFDVIHAGDVIEHLSNLGGFLEFCKNNLTTGGRIVITTPNPCERHAFKAWQHQGLYANMEHTCWITPTNMNELCRRVNLTFSESYYLWNRRRTLLNRIRQRLIFKQKDTRVGEFTYVLTKETSS